MKRPVQLLVLLVGVMPHLFGQQTYLKAYGSVQSDINRSYGILKLNDTTFVLGGDWNGVGFFMKVNHKGNLIDYFFLDNVIPGNSSVKDMTLDINNNIIATGECDHCIPGDTLKKVFTVATEPSLLLITKKIHQGTIPDNNQIYSPSIARKGDQFIVAATEGGQSPNLEDITLISTTANLNTTWRKSFNSCDDCGVDLVMDIVATTGGYAVLALNNHTDSLTIFHVDINGNLIWKKRHARASGSSWFKLAYLPGAIYACGSEPVAGAGPTHTAGFIRRFSETDGSLTSSLSLDIPDIDDEVVGLAIANDGTMLAIHRRAVPNIFGSYQVSRIYRINVGTSQVIDFTEIPNPDVLTGIGATDVVSLKNNGSEFAVSGIRGFYNRSFFYSKNSIGPAPPIAVFDVSPDTACAPSFLYLTNNIAGAVSYSWFLDGELFSTEKNPSPVTVSGAGWHEIKLTAMTGSQNTISNFKVLSLPEIWNECAFCDNKPDPYVVIKNASGTVLYTSAWVESYPPVSLPVNFTMTAGQNYKLEVWDDDNLGVDDFFGAFDIPGNTPGGTFSLVNPNDPANPLTISFTATLITQSETHSKTVLVYQPSVTLQNGTVLIAKSGNPAPGYFSWQWYLNGEPIAGATADTLTPTVGGNYAVALVTPDCSALSNVVSFTPALLAPDFEVTPPSCFGEANGSLLVHPVGGTAPYSYTWNPPDLSGNNPDGLVAGTYFVTITDASGQTATAQTALTEPAQLSVSTMAEDLTCAGSGNGSLIVTPTGGTGPFSYLWNSPTITGSQAENLPAGNYAVTVTDAQNCTATASFTLTEPDALTASATAENPSCSEASNGSILLDIEGGTVPYAVTWNQPSALGNHPVDLTAGAYSATITDANGCLAFASVILVAPPSLGVTTSSTPQTGNASLGTASVNPDGGTPPYTYLWNDPFGQSTSTAVDLTSGNYSVTVTDNNGCTVSTTVFVDFINAAKEAVLQHIRVFPNPTTGLVFIETERPVVEPAVLEIFDPLGRVLWKKNGIILPAKVNLSEYPEGLYLLVLKVGERRMAAKIVLKKW